MSLSDRKQSVLEAVVSSYIENGEPVSSKLICDIMDIGFSSATIRNELLELCEMGFLMQPHTSAGRIPTEEGYRFYVERLLKRRSIADATRLVIDTALEDITRYPEKACENAGKLLSEIVGLPVLSGTVEDRESVLKKVEIIRLGRCTVLVAVVTGGKTAGTRICNVGSEIPDDVIASLKSMIEDEIIGMRICDISVRDLHGISSKIGFYSAVAYPILNTVYELANELCRSSLFVCGEAKLLPYGINQVQQLLDGLSDRRSVSTLLEVMDRPIGVVFGGDTYIRGLEPFGLVVAGFRMGDKRRGRLCVIGPRRMNYDVVVPAIEYFAARLDSIMKNVFRDLEE